MDVDSDDDIKLVYTMEDLDRWIEEADQDEREGKLIPYDEAYKEEMRKPRRGMEGQGICR
ncbi:hypothetical protein [Candidatus Azobacteroides pseudotrichonymphae]|uniref:hypothetical protein n=1 Tax=Candidatus Azobacteroides pseudotrichonymphae TaxID=511435 RepID=UPI00223C5A7E|nr:hypothetical protein [Candidatus Azobacteroides pseudotrichonymphae]